jgi:SAM-dependent methyltransferase
MKKLLEVESHYKPVIKYLENCKGNEKIKLLEIGAGSKILKKFLPKNVIYHSLDYKGEHTYLANLDDGKLKIKSNDYDVVVCLETLEHTLYPKEVLKEIKRVSKKNGVVFLSMPNEYNLYLRVLYLFGKKNWAEKDPFLVVQNHHHIQKPRVKDILKLFGENFQIEKKYYFWFSNLVKKRNYLKPLDYLIQILGNICPSLFARNVEVKAINKKE